MTAFSGPLTFHQLFPHHFTSWPSHSHSVMFFPGTSSAILNTPSLKRSHYQELWPCVRPAAGSHCYWELGSTGCTGVDAPTTCLLLLILLLLLLLILLLLLLLLLPNPDLYWPTSGFGVRRCLFTFLAIWTKSWFMILHFVKYKFRFLLLMKKVKITFFSSSENTGIKLCYVMLNLEGGLCQYGVYCHLCVHLYLSASVPVHQC